MAFPTSVNSQITDAVTQANTKVLGDAPPQAMSNLYTATSQALSNAAHNATSSQQQTGITAQAATTMGVAMLYSIDTASTGVATSQIFTSTVEGHIHSRIASPQGKRALQRAVEQANADIGVIANEEARSKAHDAIVEAIKTALDSGLSKQQVCYQLHQVAYDRGLSMLYPVDTRGEEVTTAQIEQYYANILTGSSNPD